MYDELGLTKVTSKSSFLYGEPERRISKGYDKGIGPRSSLSVYILGLGPNLRTKGCPKIRKHYQKGLH